MVLRAFFVWAVLGTTAAPSADAIQSASPPATPAAVRMEFRNNRVFIPLTVSGPQETAVVATFWVDSGGDSVILSGRLAHQLGLRVSAQASVGMNYTTLRPATKPKLLIAGTPIDLTRVNVFAAGGVADRNAFPGVDELVGWLRKRTNRLMFCAAAARKNCSRTNFNRRRRRRRSPI